MKSYREFWPYYMRQHQNQTCRWLHFAGTVGALGCVVTAVVTGRPWFAAAAPFWGYAAAWSGHFFFERNRPATFRYPLWSLRADFEMFVRMLLGRRL